MREYELVKQKVIEDLAKLKEKGIRFSYTGDEWVSTSNKKYLNLNVHYIQKQLLLPWTCEDCGIYASRDSERNVCQTFARIWY